MDLMITGFSLATPSQTSPGTSGIFWKLPAQHHPPAAPCRDLFWVNYSGAASRPGWTPPSFLLWIFFFFFLFKFTAEVYPWILNIEYSFFIFTAPTLSSLQEFIPGWILTFLSALNINSFFQFFFSSGEQPSCRVDFSRSWFLILAEDFSTTAPRCF